MEREIEFSPRHSGGETSYVAHDQRTGKYFRFGQQEYHAVTLLDGTRDLVAVRQQLNQDGVPWTLSEVAGFAAELVKHRLAIAQTIRRKPKAQTVSTSRAGTAEASKLPMPPLTGVDEIAEPQKTATVGQHDLAASASPAKQWSIKSIVGHWPRIERAMSMMLSQRVPLLNGDRVATRFLPIARPLFSPPALAMWTLLVLVGWAMVASNASAFRSELSRLFDSHLWLLLILVWCGLKLVHEIGHAVCASHHGVRVGRMGVMFFLMAPLAYVDVTDAWKLPSRAKRIQIALAGVYFELAIGAAAAILWWMLPIGFWKHLAAQVFLVAGPATLLVNANPLLRLDGYYVLSDWLEIPNLRMHGRSQLVAALESRLIGLPKRDALLSGWRRPVATLHAFCSVLFQCLWMGGLVVAVSMWAKGLGLILGVVAVALWVVIPLLKWMAKIWMIQPRDGWRLSGYQRRLIGTAAVVAIAIQYLATATSPLDRRVPVVVRYQDEQIARAPAGAFVQRVFVRCGDRVSAGQLLMILEQPELTVQRDELVDRRESALVRAAQHRQHGDVALASSAKQDAESLQRQIDEIEQQLSDLHIISLREGNVNSPDVHQLVGRYMAPGAELIRVSDPREKEILAVVSQSDMTAYQAAAERHAIASVRLRGGKRISAQVTSIQPRAGRNIPHPALAATAGGPLAVEPSQRTGEMQVVEPQLASVIPLDTVTSIKTQAGQTGRLTIPDDRSFVSRLIDYAVRR
ncbi:Peptidase family M50 [Stieleria varia]|uniref:Peptidase family M50 n=2 Tax=Stieleria varia TaxID=2528005 RepID=A0A5C6B414_9BACT|nr:Peptidase family M50 [Stieleria varia]